MGIHRHGISESSPAHMDAAHAHATAGATGFILIAVSAALVLGIAVIFGVRRRRQRQNTELQLTGDSNRLDTPTDFMSNLAALDRCHTMDEILEKRRRAVWTLELFENHGNASHGISNDFSQLQNHEKNLRSHANSVS